MVWGAVAQRLEHATDDRVFAGLNFGNFLFPPLPASFGRDTKRRRSLLSGVYARGSKRSHTGGKCVTCCGLHNSTWSIVSTGKGTALMSLNII